MSNEDFSIENAVLGNVLSFPNESRVVMESLSEDDFLNPKNKVVFRALKEIYDAFVKEASHRPFDLDIATVIDHLAKSKEKSKAGGESHIEYLQAAAIGNTNLDSYIRKIKNATLVRKCIVTFDTFKNIYNEKALDFSVFLGQVEQQIVSITRQREVTEFSKISDALEQMAVDFKNPTNNVYTGFDEFDRITEGFQPGYLCILAARPSVGKTAIAINFALNVALKNRAVGIFSLEMDKKQIAMRMLQNRSMVDGKGIHQVFEEKNDKSEEVLSNKTAVYKGIDRLKNLPIFIDDSPGQKLSDILAKSRKLKAACPNLSLIVIDYIGLIVPDVTRKDGNRQQEVAQISASLKGLAKELAIPVLALSQLSRGVDQRKNHSPELWDLRESGAIEQDADQVFLLYRPDYYRNDDDSKKKDETEVPSPADTEVSPISKVILNIAKNRNGRTGIVEFEFDKPHCHFEIPDLSMEDILNDN